MKRKRVQMIVSEVGTACLALFLIFCSCTPEKPQPKVKAAYYWSTTLRMDSARTAFIQSHGITRLYVRYFDVVNTREGPMPNATLAFNDSMPADVEIVPTVFITNDCMAHPQPQLGEMIAKRVLQMNETNDIERVSEIQIDCDYTDRSRATYYDFLSEVRREAESQGLRLSTTIRLHQLSMPPPPADYGVLMLYNTGSPRNFVERNPVLDFRDVQPYLSRLDDYELPLAAAYPVFLWQREINGVRIEHEVTADEILRVKKAVEHQRPELRHTILTYHLDNENINRYNTETYEAIYHH